MIIHALSAMSEFNVKLPGAYFPHVEVWFLDLWSTNIEARYDICLLHMPEMV